VWRISVRAVSSRRRRSARPAGRADAGLRNAPQRNLPAIDTSDDTCLFYFLMVGSHRRARPLLVTSVVQVAGGDQGIQDDGPAERAVSHSFLCRWSTGDLLRFTSRAAGHGPHRQPG